MTDVAIVGGGITSLAAAWELQQRGVDYMLLEAADRLGGKIVTERADGFIVDGAADSFLTQKPWAWQLCHELGLRDRLVGTNQQQRTVYLWHAGQLHPMPRGLRLIAPLDEQGLRESALLSEHGKRQMLAERLLPPRADDGDESLGAFVRRRFGREALALFGEPLMAGIYVGQPNRLSMQATFPQLLSLERRHGSVTLGMQQAPAGSVPPDAPPTPFVSLAGGMGELIDGLAARLTGAVRLGQPVRRLAADGTLYLASGERFRPTAVVVTTPASAASRLLAEPAPAAAARLRAIRTVSSGTVALGFRAADLDRPLDGVGVIIPRREPTRLLACTFSSTKLPGRAPDGYALLRVFVGGHGRARDVALPDEQLIALARAELGKVVGIRATPVQARVFRWRRANPQYEVGHLARVAEIRALCPPWLALAGASYEGVGIPDCVRQGRAAARAVVERG